MSKLDRRRLLQGGAALGAGAALLGGGPLLGRAWAGAPPFQPEPGATLRLMRWKPLVEAEGKRFDLNVTAFTAATGVEVRLDRVFIDDVQPKAIGRRQCRCRARPRVGRQHHAPSLPGPADRRDRGRRLSRRQVRRLVRDRARLWHARRPLDRSSAVRRRQRHQLPSELARGCRLRPLSGRPPTIF